MLEKIRYTGYEVKKSSFENYDIESEGGFISLNGVVSEEVSATLNDDEDAVFSIMFEVTFSAIDRETKENVFQCVQVLSINFLCELETLEDKDRLEPAVKDNVWFLKNFIDLSVKSSLENALHNTEYEGIEIPYEVYVSSQA